MKTLLRWGKFNLVGATGMVLQLVVLALLHRGLHIDYLIASAIAVELTIVHNFFWHLRFTWSDRRDQTGSRFMQFLRFQLSNGLVSLLGNLALMRLLVTDAFLPVLAANLVAIFCCSVANFFLAHRWAFRGRTISRVAVGVALLLSVSNCHAQTTGTQSLPDAPSVSRPSYQPDPRVSYIANTGIFCGTGASTSQVATKPTIGCGAGMSVFPPYVFFEFGVMGPQANRSDISGYVSVDGNIPLARRSSRYRPFAVVGYSRLFETGHALDYGIALALPRASKPNNLSKSFRIELRDYYTFASPNQHNVMLRLGWMEQAMD